MRNITIPLSAILIGSALLAGCTASDEDELRAWMAQERANAKPRVTPLEEPKPFKPQAYTAGEGMDPFNPLKLIQVLRRESAQANISTDLLAPELNRRKEPLEAEPLDAMTMVGSLVTTWDRTTEKSPRSLKTPSNCAKLFRMVVVTGLKERAL